MKKVMERFTHWLEFPSLDPQLRIELETIQDQPQEIKERFYTHLSFGTGGVRGVLGAGTNRLNIYTIRKTTLGLARFLTEEYGQQNGNGGQKKLSASEEKPSIGEVKRSGQQEKKAPQEISVVIAYDCRHQSPEFAIETALTLAKQGIKAYLYPSLRSTPQLSYSVRKLSASAGVMITASHNPPEYNGYKVYGADGAQLNLEQAAQVLQHVHQVEDELTIEVLSQEEALDQGLLHILDATLDQSYLDYVYSLSLQPELIKSMADRLRIVFTPLHGTAYLPVQHLLAQAGFTQVSFVAEQTEPDPNFSTVRSPNPEEAEAFTLGIKVAQEIKADLIMGTDPDADRIGLVVPNEQGEYQLLSGNQIGALLLDYILTQKKVKGELSSHHVVCKTIVTSELGRAIATSFGLKTIDTLTGFKFIGEKIKQFKESDQEEFVFGYEESYGYLYGDEVRDKDAIQIVLLLAEMGAYYKSIGKGIYQALIEIYERYGYYQEDLVSFTFKGIEGLSRMNQVMERMRQEPPQSVANQAVILREDYGIKKRWLIEEGVEEQIELPSSNVLKFYLENETWFCIRPSGTEPKLKLYFGTKADSLERATENLKQVMAEVIKLIE